MELIVICFNAFINPQILIVIQKFNEDLSAIEKSMIKKGTFCSKHTFPPFDVCERVNQSEMFRREMIHSEHSLLIYSFTSLRRRKFLTDGK